MAVHSPQRSLTGISLCSGIGGIDLGLKLAMGQQYSTVCYVEGEAYCASVLAARMQEGALCDAPIWSDVKTFDARPWRGGVDIVSVGYPCQPFSNAGKRAGADDPRHLWPHVARIIAVVKPAYVFAENVPGHVSLGLRDVRCDLQGLGYSVYAGLFSAAECGAPHIRKRLFILAHTNRRRGRSSIPERVAMGQSNDGVPTQRHQGCGGPIGSRAYVADANGERQLQPQGHKPAVRRRPANGGQADVGGRALPNWVAEPNVGRLVDGIPHRVDRLRALGNAVVPAVACRAWSCLIRQAARAVAYPAAARAERPLRVTTKLKPKVIELSQSPTKSTPSSIT